MWEILLFPKQNQIIFTFFRITMPIAAHKQSPCQLQPITFVGCGRVRIKQVVIMSEIQTIGSLAWHWHNSTHSPVQEKLWSPGTSKIHPRARIRDIQLQTMALIRYCTRPASASILSPTPFIHSSIRLFVHPSIHPSICPPTHSFSQSVESLYQAQGWS